LLLRSAITGEKLLLPEGFCLEEADSLVRAQSLTPMVYLGAYNCGISPKSELMLKYQQLYFQNLMRHQQQARAIDEIYRNFEENGIDYLPLKGCIMKPLYPNPEMRIMGDADILIRMEDREKLQFLMEKLGFHEEKETYHEWIWTRNDLFLELHKCLFAEVERDFAPVFGDGWEKARKVSGCRYALPPEETYLFLFTHMAKHYRNNGIGARQFVDLFVYRRAHPELDEEAVCRTMNRLHLLEFYRNTRNMLLVWFENGQPDEKTERMTRYVLSGGNWGDEETGFVTVQAKSGHSGDARARAVWEAIFPPLERMRYSFRILFKYPFLYPFLWPVRWVQGILTRPGQILRKFRVIGGVSNEKVDRRLEELESVGLKFYEE